MNSLHAQEVKVKKVVSLHLLDTSWYNIMNEKFKMW